MLKQTLIRFAVLFTACTAAVLLLHSTQTMGSCVFLSLALAFFVYAFAWARGPLAWLAAFASKYGFIALLFGSLPGILLIVLFAAIGFQFLCLAAVVVGAVRFVLNIGYSIYLDRRGCPPSAVQNRIDL